MTSKPTKDWDDAFANMAHVSGSETFPAIWQAEAAAYRASGVTVEEHSYGSHDRERYDLILPDHEPKGLAVFIHGGYWMRFDKSLWTHYAEGARALGWAVCMPSYTLTPEAHISHITRQMGQAIAAAAKRVDGPLRLAGHSAGGHLVTRLLCDDTPVQPALAQRMEHTLSISGVHDLRPLLHTALNDTLQLDRDEATRESPVLHQPQGTPAVTAWVGGGERPEFIRQAELLSIMWSGLDADITGHIDGDHNHFTVLDSLRDSSSAITRAFVGE